MADLDHRVGCCLVISGIGSVVYLLMMILVAIDTSPKPNQYVNINLTLMEVRHIAFVKVHKASSSTVLNILYRFGYERNLVYVLPKRGNYLGHNQSGIIGRNVLPPPRNKPYDILCNHCVFNEDSFGRFLPYDTMYIGIAREPFQRLQSAYYYYRNVYSIGYLKQTSGFEQFVSNQMYIEPRNPYVSKTNNRMAIDFGFPAIDFNNVTKLKTYLNRLDSKFSLVMLTEYFDESVVLLRRILNWQIKDILYISQNSFKHSQTRITENLMEKVRNFTHIDYVLYDFFHEKFLEKLRQQPKDFADELFVFKEIRTQVEKFCRSRKSYGRSLPVNKTIWNPSLTIRSRDCAMMNTVELDFLRVIREKHKRRLKREGASKTFPKY